MHETNELNKLYEAMCLSWGAQVKEQGRLVFMIDGEEFPLRIDGMTLHLPLSEVLDGNCVDKVFFHPACENIVSKETEVFKIIRRMTCMKLLDTFRRIPMVLFTVAGHKPKSTWNQRIHDMLEPLKGAKRAVRDELNALFSRMHVEVEENGLDNRFIHFKVSKGGGTSKTTGQRIYYKTRPEFPFYTEIVRRLARSDGQSDNQTIEINNHTVSRAALRLAAHIFQNVLPAVNSPSDYEFESTSPVASRLVSYMGCYAEIADQLNKIQNTFRSDFDKAGLYPIDLSWTERLEELPDIYRQVPVLDYNSHNTHDEVQHQAVSRNDMGGLLSVTSTNQQGVSQHQSQQQHVAGMNGDYDVSPPQMQAGDRYVRTEIDYVGQRVLHHAVNQTTNNPVVYICSRKGNFLQRSETNMMLQQMGMLGGMGSMMGGTMLANGMVQLPNGMIVNPQMMGGVSMPTPTATPSVYPDTGMGFDLGAPGIF